MFCGIVDVFLYVGFEVWFEQGSAYVEEVRHELATGLHHPATQDLRPVRIRVGCQLGVWVG